MKYKIVELNEDNLEKFDGKIIKVIDSHKKAVKTGTDIFGLALMKDMWILTCLVEVDTL